MNDEDRAAGLAAWLKTRPECVQKLAAEFPIGTVFDMPDRTLYLVGYTENDRLIVSRFDPYKDYDAAVSNSEYLCAGHVRNLS